MEPVPDVLGAYLLVDARERCRALEARATTLCHSEFASENPKYLLQLYARLSKALRRHLEIDSLRLDDIRNVNDFICELSAHLRYAEAALSSRIPWSLPRPLEQLLTRFIPDATIMLRPQWKHNFSIILEDLGAYYRTSVSNLFSPAELDEVFADFPSRFHVVSFPAIERLNVFLHCDLAHEIGHLVAEDYLAQEPIPYVHKFTKLIRSQHSNASTNVIQNYLSEAISLRRRAIEELASDVFAMRCLGPAAFLALASMLATDNLDRTPSPDTAYYPPGRYRLRVALQTLRYARLLPDQSDSLPEQYSPLLEYFEDMRRCVQIRTDQDAIMRGPFLVQIAYESVRETIPRVRSYVLNKYRGRFIRRKDLYVETQELVSRLSGGVPPNEVRVPDAARGEERLGRPAALEAILNAAWFYRLLFLEKGTPEAGLEILGPKDFKTLSRLTLKAVELARIFSEYLEWESRDGDSD